MTPLTVAPMKTWQDAAERQAELVSSLARPWVLDYWSNRDPAILEYAHNDSARRTYATGEDPDPAFAGGKTIADARETLLLADPFYIDATMEPVFDALRESYEVEPLAERHLLTDRGFAYLPWLLRLRWRPDQQWDPRVQALAWHRWPWGVSIYVFGPNADPAVRARYGGPLGLFHAVRWAFGNPPPEGEWPIIQPVMAMLVLLAQRIAVRTRERPPSPTRKRVERAGLPAKDIIVVTLRRAEGDERAGEGAAVDWSHRWIVRHHPRHQWYPRLGEHRWIVVADYVKGPPDKPLMAGRRRAFALVR